MNFENLNKLPIEELRSLAAKQGIKVHHKMKPETLAKAIAASATEPQVNKTKEQLKHTAELPKAPAKINTEEEVRDVCQKFFAKEGYEAIFKDEIWHFKYNGSEDSGHMSVPLRIIRMKAENVSRGARKPITMTFDGERIFAAG